MVKSLKKDQPVKVRYTNWKGQTSLRTIEPIKLFWGSTEYHPEEQWLLKCWDVEKGAERTFAMKDIHSWGC